MRWRFLKEEESCSRCERGFMRLVVVGKEAFCRDCWDLLQEEAREALKATVDWASFDRKLGEIVDRKNDGNPRARMN